MSPDYDHLEKFLRKNPRGLVVLLGPTASGKTALSLELAKKIDGEIISADSRQVYRQMDIGTDKILPEQRRGIPHWLIDVAEPNERFTVADFKRLAEEKIEEILARGRVPFLVGGTGLYIDAVTKNFTLAPENREVRAELENELAEKGAAFMHAKLASIDSEKAAKIPVRNPRYILRALEIYKIAKHDNEQSDAAKQGSLRWPTLKIGLKVPNELLFERINRRVDEQLERGLVEETRTLLAKFGPDLESMTSLGYGEIAAYLAGKISLTEAAEEIKKNTRNYAKRQMTWFKRDKEIMWIIGGNLS